MCFDSLVVLPAEEFQKCLLKSHLKMGSRKWVMMKACLEHRKVEVRNFLLNEGREVSLSLECRVLKR